MLKIKDTETTKGKIIFRVFKNIRIIGYKKGSSYIIPFPSDIKELKAINKKFEELGWI